MATAAAPVVAAATPIGKARKLPAPNSDFYQLVDVLTAEELAIVRQVRAYMETKVQPIINALTFGASRGIASIPRLLAHKLVCHEGTPRKLSSWH